MGDGWIPSGDSDWQDDYHGEFRGFATGLITSPAGDLTVEHYASTEGWDSPASDAGNYTAGQLYDREVYQGSYVNDAKLLQKTAYTYAGTNGTHTSCSSTYSKSPYVACEIITLSTRTTLYEETGSSNANAPWSQKDDTYDDYSTSSGLGDHHLSPATGSYHNLQQEVTSSSNAPTLTQHWTYDTTDTTVGSTVYYDVNKVAHSDLVDASNHLWQCADTTYDQGTASGVPTPAAGWATTETAYSDCATQSSSAITTYTGYDGNGNVVASVDGVGAAYPSLYSSTGCTLSTAPQFFPTGSWSSSHYTDCTAYDATSAQPTDTWNALSQHSSTSYDATQGLLPVKTVDVNSQATTTAYSYDANGNLTTSISQPGESGSYTTRASSLTTCTDSSSLPCFEEDGSTALYSSALTRIFYDSLGREVETLTPGPDSTHTTVSFTVYDDQAHSVFTSHPFVVASRSTWLDPSVATDDTGSVPGGTMTVLDPLGRTLSVTDALSAQSSTTYSLGTSGVSGDNNTYALTTHIDANQHVQLTYTDALGRTIYTVADSGKNGGTLTPVQRTSSQYNALDKPTSITVTDLAPQTGQTITTVTTTASYDDLGRLTSLNDPDRGDQTYTYNADGDQLTAVSGTRTIGTSYDLLERVGCLQDAAPTTDGSGTCSSGSHPLVQNTYDVSKLGTAGSSDFPVGQLTQSLATTYYPDGSASTATQQFQHDQRGRLITSTLQLGVPASWNVTTALPTYQQSLAYNDANQLTTTQTTVGGQTGYTFTQSYDGSTGSLNGLSNTSTGTPTLAALSDNAQALPGDLSFKDSNGDVLADEVLQYDGDLRPTSATTTWQSASGSSGTVVSSSRSYDAVGNVLSASTTLAAVPGQSTSGGSETQNFCYNEQNELVWAGNSGTQAGAGNGTCGSATLSNSLNGAGYSVSFAYTHLGQLWQGPLAGSGASQQYLYCDSSHPHQVSGLYPTGTTCSNLTGASYSVTYDSWGNVTSRTYNGTTATLSYDVLDQLTQWDAGSSNQDWYAYDASGHRVLARSTTSNGTSLTTYAFGLEEHSYDGTGTPTGNTYYYLLAGRLIGALTGTTTLATHFFLTDALGSVLSTFSALPGSAAVLGNQVYGPYGTHRYQQGTLGTSKGFTGQDEDATGLDYYNARYYDPIVGLFLSADVVQGNLQGFNPYAYVSGNPETLNDPTGLWGWGDTALSVGIGGTALGVVGALAVGVALAVTAPAWVPVAGAVAVGVGLGILVGGAVSAITYLHAHPTTRPDQAYMDDFYQHILTGEIVGGVTGGLLSFGSVAGPLFAGDAAGATGAAVKAITGRVWRTVGVSGGGGLLSGLHNGNFFGGNSNNGNSGSNNDIKGGSGLVRRSSTGNSGYLPVKYGKSGGNSTSQSSSSSHSPNVGRQPSPSTASYYTVASGDSLWAIASRFYGSGFQWGKIYGANTGVIGSNPNLIYPGERLVIPR